ncbi:MAG: amino acid transporter [Bacillaceae bacterium]|nr:amino acid transporter [Bacillaceae bacterium]
MEPIIHGIILAFGLILPLGAQNVFVFNQGAVQSPLIRALPVVLTAALCDTLLITLAVLGVSVIVLTFAWLKLTIFAIGFFFLLYLGWSIWHSDPSVDHDTEHQMSMKQQILFAMSVSLLNPHAILDTIGVIGTSSLSYSGTDKLAFSLACILVSWLWFVFLAVSGHLVGKVDTQGLWIKRLNKISAIIIWGVGLYIGRQVLSLLGTGEVAAVISLGVIFMLFLMSFKVSESKKAQNQELNHDYKGN